MVRSRARVLGLISLLAMMVKNRDKYLATELTHRLFFFFRFSFVRHRASLWKRSKESTWSPGALFRLSLERISSISVGVKMMRFFLFIVVLRVMCSFLKRFKFKLSGKSLQKIGMLMSLIGAIGVFFVNRAHADLKMRDCRTVGSEGSKS